MTMSRLETVIRFFAVLLVDVLNPLFVISIALVTSVGYLLTLLMPVTIDLWQALFWVCTGVPLILLLARAYAAKRQSVPAQAASWRVVLPFAVPMLVLAPGVYAEFANATLQTYSHADLHIGYVHQVLYGTTPMDSLFVLGYPANYYWLYHAYCAALVKITALNPLVVTSAVNIAAIFSCLLWIAQILLAVKLARARTLYLGVLVIFVYTAINLTGILTLLSHLLGGGSLPDASHIDFLRITLLEGADRRLMIALDKAVNFSSTTIGITFFSAALYACVDIVKNHLNLRSLVLISACGIASLAVYQIGVIYIVAALLGGIAVMAAIRLIRSPNRKELALTFWDETQSKVPPRLLLGWFALSLILSLPLLEYNSVIAYNGPNELWVDGTVHMGSSIMVFDFFSAVSLRMILAAVLLLVPLFGLQCVFVLQRGRNRDYPRDYIQISGLITLLLAVNLVIFELQYKTVYFIAILMAISSLFALQTLQNSAKNHWRWVGRVIADVLLILCFSQVVYFNYHILYRADNLDEFRRDGFHIEYVTDPYNRAAAHYWIRDNTPLDAIVISPIGSSIKWTNILSERMFYVRRSQNHFTNNTDYDERVAEVRAFYREDMPLTDYQILEQKLLQSFPGRAIYAVVKDAEVSPQAMAERGAELVYEHEGGGANVYWLNPMLGV